LCAITFLAQRDIESCWVAAFVDEFERPETSRGGGYHVSEKRDQAAAEVGLVLQEARNQLLRHLDESAAETTRGSLGAVRIAAERIPMMADA
jgi:hypothetical protein